MKYAALAFLVACSSRPPHPPPPPIPAALAAIARDAAITSGLAVAAARDRLVVAFEDGAIRVWFPDAIDTPTLRLVIADR